MARLPRQLESVARMLTYILSHRPDEFGLVLSEEGFIPIKHLLQVLSAEPGWGFVRRYHLDQIVGLMSPPAFEVEGERIRALKPKPQFSAVTRASPPRPCFTSPSPPRPTPGCGRRGSSRCRTGSSSWPRPRSWQKSWGGAGPRIPSWSPSRPSSRPGGHQLHGLRRGFVPGPAPAPGFSPTAASTPGPGKAQSGKTPARGPDARQLRHGPARDAAPRGQSRSKGKKRTGLEGRDPGAPQTKGKRGKGERAKRLRLPR